MNEFLEYVIAILLIAFAGGLVFYNLLPMVFMDKGLRKDIGKLRAYIARKFKIITRYGTELGGYVHDTHVSFWLPANIFNYVTGTWADAAGAVANTFGKKASLGDNTATISIPVNTLMNSVDRKGFYLTSIDVWFDITGAAVTALDALIYKATLPVNAAAFGAPASLAFSYDTGHDTAGERDNLDEHKMTLTLTTPEWIDDDELISVEIIIDGATSCVVQFHGARANGTLRL